MARNSNMNTHFLGGRDSFGGMPMTTNHLAKVRGHPQRSSDIFSGDYLVGGFNPSEKY